MYGVLGGKDSDKLWDSQTVPIVRFSLNRSLNSLVKSSGIEIVCVFSINRFINCISTDRLLLGIFSIIPL